MKRLNVTRLLPPVAAWMIGYNWPRGIAALIVGMFWRFDWRHWYGAGMSRHVVYVGPIGIEWAYWPRSVSLEQAQEETAAAIAETIRKAIDR